MQTRINNTNLVLKYGLLAFIQIGAGNAVARGGRSSYFGNGLLWVVVCIALFAAMVTIFAIVGSLPEKGRGRLYSSGNIVVGGFAISVMLVLIGLLLGKWPSAVFLLIVFGPIFLLTYSPKKADKRNDFTTKRKGNLSDEPCRLKGLHPVLQNEETTHGKSVATTVSKNTSTFVKDTPISGQKIGLRRDAEGDRVYFEEKLRRFREKRRVIEEGAHTQNGNASFVSNMVKTENKNEQLVYFINGKKHHFHDERFVPVNKD